MKKIIKFTPYLIALLPQFFIGNYIWYMITIVLIGFIARYVIKPKKVFLTMFLVELVAFSVLFLVLKDRVFYVKEIVEGAGIPVLSSTMIFILFNALNIAVLFFTGYTLSQVFSTKKVALLKE